MIMSWLLPMRPDPKPPRRINIILQHIYHDKEAQEVIAAETMIKVAKEEPGGTNIANLSPSSWVMKSIDCFKRCMW